VRALAFAGAAALILFYALRGGGSYDIVSFEELGLVIWWALAIGIGLGLLPRRRPSRAAIVLLAALAAYAAWTAFSLLWTQSSELTTEELARSLDYLGLVALAVCLLDRDSWRDAAAGLVFGALLVCVIAVGSRLAPSVFGVDHVDAVLHLDRLAYPFGYWNAAAAWGAMCIALGLTWSAHESARMRRTVALGLVPVAATMTYLTYSRGGLAGAALAVVAAVAFSRNRLVVAVHAAVAAAGSALAIVAVRSAPQIAHATGTSGAASVFGALVFAGAICALTALLTRQAKFLRRGVPISWRRPLAVVGIGALVAAAAAAGPLLGPRAWHSFAHSPPPPAADATGRLTTLASNRYVVWKSAIKGFDAHPAGGTGAGTFEFWWNEHGTNGEFIRDAHNIWLENMVELGLPGLLLIVAVAAAAIGGAVVVRARARRSATAGAAAAFAAALVVYLLHASVDWMWESTAVTVLALGGVGVLSGRRSGSRPRLNVPLRALLVTGAAAAALLQLPGLISTLNTRSSQAAERAGNVALALSRARNAVSAEPWSASAHEQEALVLESEGSLSQAKHAETLAISDEPTNYAHWMIRSRIETQLDQLAAAVHDYGRAVQLRPHALVFALAPYFRNS
jgi:O-antigen ligase